MDKLSRQVFNLIQKWNYGEDEFDTDQLTELYLGLKNGLSEEQVRVYMVPSLTADQMMICRQYGETGFNQEQIDEVYRGLKYGLTKEQIKLYADKKYNWIQRYQIRYELENGLSVKQLKEKYTFFKPEENSQQNEPEIEV